MTQTTLYFPAKPSERRASASAAALLKEACASLEKSSNLLAEAAAGLSSAIYDLRAISVVKTKKPKPARKALQPKVSPFFPIFAAHNTAATDAPQPEKKPRRKTKKTIVSQIGPQISPFFALPLPRVDAASPIPIAPGSLEPFSQASQPPGLAFTLQPAHFGLIQERICTDLYALVVQAILWNKTRGVAARPVLFALLTRYPTPHALAAANFADVENLIRALGLQQRRAQRLVDMAIAWVTLPPSPERRYGRRNYPAKGSNPAVKDGELLGPEDAREGWEIGHLPGVGEYALDSFRIFGRDRLRGVVEGGGVELEWKRLVPRDKELGPYIKWKWALEGWDYDLATGVRRRMG